MKNLFIIILFLSITGSMFAQIQPKVSPILSGGYTPGIIGVRDYANPGKEGLFLIDYNLFLSADSYYDRNGDKANSIDILNQSIPINVDISGYINSLMFVYASPKLKFLGNAQYLFIAAPNYTSASTSVGLEHLASEKPTAYMCSEAVWWRCHRSMVSDYLKVRGWTVLHIMAIGKVQEHPYTSPARIVNNQVIYTEEE